MNFWKLIFWTRECDSKNDYLQYICCKLSSVELHHHTKCVLPQWILVHNNSYYKKISIPGVWNKVTSKFKYYISIINRIKCSGIPLQYCQDTISILTVKSSLVKGVFSRSPTTSRRAPWFVICNNPIHVQ